ncbi:hypothetical protein Ancab_028246 [Ancistrocladus abbreviatus]
MWRDQAKATPVRDDKASLLAYTERKLVKELVKRETPSQDRRGKELLSMEDWKRSANEARARHVGTIMGNHPRQCNINDPAHAAPICLTAQDRWHNGRGVAMLDFQPIQGGKMSCPLFYVAGPALPTPAACIAEGSTLHGP